MKKSSLLFILFIFCITSNRSIAQADSSVINAYTNNSNTIPEDKAPANDESSVAPGIRIFSSPVKDLLQIEGLDASAKNVITVSSSYGKVIYQSRSSGSATYSANVSKLKPGIYYVTIKEKDQSTMLRFIKI
jgi:Secretion system C-terminal sorting domain